MEWNLEPPDESELKDREVRPLGRHMEGKRVALLITGSIAAYRCPDLVRDLRREGADVRVFATREGLRYVSRDALEWNALHPVIDQFSPHAEHLHQEAPIDAYLVAPASYSVINKSALGLADSVVTSTIASALGQLEHHGTPVLFAPAMHGSMHQQILTDSLRRLRDLGVELIEPRQSHGKNNLASLETIVTRTIRALSSSKLRGHRLLITGGPTPVPLDRIRCITTVFTGTLAVSIAREAWLRGADVQLLLGRGSIEPPKYLHYRVVSDFENFRVQLFEMLDEQQSEWGIFTAAVADYQPECVYDGKWSSEEKVRTLNLIQTPKLIEEVRTRFPGLQMVPFKYEEAISHEELMETARGRLEKGGYPLLVANCGDESRKAESQVAWLIRSGEEPLRMEGKSEIASALLDRIESLS